MTQRLVPLGRLRAVTRGRRAYSFTSDGTKIELKGGLAMSTHSYKNHEIEVFTRDNGDFIEASAKFKPMHGYLGTFSMWGKFSSVEAAEQTVLEEAKRIIDNRSK
jgi:hypothetical protein